MADKETAIGRRELRDALFTSKRLLVGVGVFSAFVNILMLTGSIFMLQVYDRVLASNSEATLVSLFSLVCALFLFMGLLDHARARILARAGARFQELLDKRVFDAVLRQAVAPGARSRPQSGLRDLETIQRVLSSLPLSPFSTCPGHRSSSSSFSPSTGSLASWRWPVVLFCSRSRS